MTCQRVSDEQSIKVSHVLTRTELILGDGLLVVGEYYSCYFAGGKEQGGTVLLYLAVSTSSCCFCPLAARALRLAFQFVVSWTA